MKRSLKLIMMLLMVVCLLSGCAGNNNKTTDNKGNKNGVENKESNKTAEDEKNESTVYPLTVKDGNDNEVVINEKPVKIVSMTLGTDEMLIEMVNHERITAISGAIAEDEGISNISEIAKKFEKAESNIELIISMEPDLVFVASWMAKEKIQQLLDAGISVYVYKTASTIEEQMEIIKELAMITDEIQKGNEMVADMQKRLDAVTKVVSEIKKEDRVRVLAYNTFGTTNAANTTFDDIVTKAGCINIASEQGLKGWPEVTKEKIVEWNPDVIIVPAWSYDKSADPNDFKEALMNDESLKDINAVKEGRIIMIQDKHIGSVSQNMILGLEDVAKAMYPELFK